MARGTSPDPGRGRQSALQQELLRLIRPYSRRLAQQPSERIRPELSATARRLAGHPADEVVPALEQVVRSVGATPDMTALAEFARDVEAGRDPFA